jgi:hypothetical protein
VCSSISEVYDTHECYVLVKLDLHRITELHLCVTARTVREAILAAPKLKIKETDVHLDHDHAIKVYAGRSDREDTAVFELQRLQMALKEVIVAGIHAIPRAIITRKEEGEKTAAEKGRVCFQLLVEGMGLQAVMGVKGLRGETARTTHVMEVEKVLGIEAARKTTMDEIQFTMRSHGMDIDDRHVTLLADVMTFRGEVHGSARCPCEPEPMRARRARAQCTVPNAQCAGAWHHALRRAQDEAERAHARLLREDLRPPLRRRRACAHRRNLTPALALTLTLTLALALTQTLNPNPNPNQARTDAIAGVSECIITGVPMPVGTVRIVSMRSSIPGRASSRACRS